MVQNSYFVVLLFLFGCSQVGDDHTYDSSTTQATKHNTLSNTIELERISTINSDSIFIAFQLDSLDEDYKNEMSEGLSDDAEVYGGWDSGYVHYALDSSLKVFTFLGEGCGAYCSPMYFNILHYQNQQLKFYAEPIEDVIRIDSTHIYLNSRGMQRLRGIEYCLFENSYVLQHSEGLVLDNLFTSRLSFFVENSEGNFAVTNNDGSMLHLNSLDSTQQELYAITFGYDESTLGDDSLVCSKTEDLYRWENGNFEKIETTFTKEKRFLHQ